MQTILVPVSVGELADKVSILQIKAERIGDTAKRAHVELELGGLLPLWRGQLAGKPGLGPVYAELKAANERMWDVQDALRAKEAAQAFDAEFVELARAVAARNGERVAAKNRINQLAGSEFVEEKQYQAQES
ncbi:hypothetical protein LY625_12675 [Lysobacter sp. GX 14042]|uniref:hypothetical protein n=1 Tax=Lysobacter sp. GX 14042 TaxID=2907155 RepID=UPI001F47E6DE|nr:hypothetical protein [Lysobacter sp. GX 14042]MCE7033455.1 hypothetical protein [Lysobacter sp. GX 14042]